MTIVLLFYFQLFILVLLVSANVDSFTANVLQHRYFRAVAAKSADGAGLPPAAANDLWAVHDLLLIGYHGIFLAANSTAKREVQDHATNLAKMLPSVHPHNKCRSDIAKLVGNNERPNISAVAEAAWACLPARFSASDFDAVFLNETDAVAAKMPHPKDQTALSSCSDSNWPRTCSYWIALHQMAFRADALQRGAEFLHAVVPLLAGGALVCDGCTHHLMELHKPVLSESMWKNRSNAI
mmetsp:Transcript_98936/g.191057  ORF Transcript_98936/g.191057 Transcript_98936/m.191057 type:complete len:239 (-) Transcript_98936:706-1422(-)